MDKDKDKERRQLRSRREKDQQHRFSASISHLRREQQDEGLAPDEEALPRPEFVSHSDPSNESHAEHVNLFKAEEDQASKNIKDHKQMLKDLLHEDNAVSSFTLESARCPWYLRPTASDESPPRAQMTTQMVEKKQSIEHLRAKRLLRESKER